MIEALKTVVVAILTGFLALSQSAASFVEGALGGGSPLSYTTIAEQVETLPSLIADKLNIHTITEQFRTDARYQQAAALGATASSTATSSTITEALVNVFCTAQSEEMSRTTTGSGVFIDSQGVILTNAHVAQFLLLEADESVATTRCVIRQGSPAVTKYEAELLYISPLWIASNAHQLYDTHPVGTGERDFALLYVTEALEGEMPETFPALSTHAQDGYRYIAAGVHAAGYPAEGRTAGSARLPLVPHVATTSIDRLYTFGSGNVELISIAPSAVGYLGSSGGPVVNEDGTIIALITTRGDREKEGAHSLRALTLPYISSTLEAETGLTLNETLTGDLALRAAAFEETLAPYLRALLSSEQE